MAQALKPAVPGESGAEKVIDMVLRNGKFSREQVISGSSPETLRLKSIAAVLLSKSCPQRDWGKIEDILDCSSSFITRAIALANEPGKNGIAFREEIERFQGEVEPKAPSPPLPSRLGHEESQIERLKRLTDVAFNATSDSRGVDLRSRKREARQAKAYILRWSLGKKLREIVDILNAEESTLSNDMKITREEYVTHGSFYEKVLMVCDELGIAPP